MNPFANYVPSYTVTQSHELLSGMRPVRVWTHAFDRADARAEEQMPPEQCCGPVYRIRRRPVVARHDHDHYEISIVIAGSAMHETAEGRSRVGAASVQVVAPGEVHGFYDIDGMHIINCAYLVEWLLYDVRELLSEEGLIPLFLHTALFNQAHRLLIPQWVLEGEILAACIRELRDIAGECEREIPSQTYLKWSLKKLMLTLGRSFASHDTTLVLPIRGDIRAALEHIEERILQCEPFSVTSLAELLGASPDYFSRVFKDATGLSPMDYFQRRRVHHACWMLLNSRQSITEVAHALGYSDSAHFSHLFKRYRGMSARDFRRKYSVG